MGIASITIGIICLTYMLVYSSFLFLNTPSSLSSWARDFDVSMFTFYVYVLSCLTGLLLGIAGRISIKRKPSIIGALLCTFCIVTLIVVYSLR